MAPGLAAMESPAMQNGVQQALATLAKLPCCNLAIGAQMLFFQDAMKNP